MVTLRVIDSGDWLQMLKTEKNVTNICTKIEQVIQAGEHVGKLHEAVKILLSYDCNMNHESTEAVMATLKVVVEHVAGKLSYHSERLSLEEGGGYHTKDRTCRSGVENGDDRCEKSLNELDSDSTGFLFQVIEELTSRGTIFNSKYGFYRDNEDGQHTAGSGSDEDVIEFDPE